MLESMALRKHWLYWTAELAQYMRMQAVTVVNTASRKQQLFGVNVQNRKNSFTTTSSSVSRVKLNNLATP